MGKTKHAKEDEYYKSIIRKQKSELRKAHQKIRQLEKELGFNNFKVDKENKVKKQSLCSECGKGETKIVDVGIRRYEICQICKHRERIN